MLVAAEALWATVAVAERVMARARVAKETAAKVRVATAQGAAASQTVVADWALRRGVEVGWPVAAARAVERLGTRAEGPGQGVGAQEVEEATVLE